MRLKICERMAEDKLVSPTGKKKAGRRAAVTAIRETVREGIEERGYVSREELAEVDADDVIDAVVRLVAETARVMQKANSPRVGKAVIEALRARTKGVDAFEMLKRVHDLSRETKEAVHNVFLEAAKPPAVKAPRGKPRFAEHMDTLKRGRGFFPSGRAALVFECLGRASDRGEALTHSALLAEVVQSNRGLSTLGLPELKQMLKEQAKRMGDDCDFQMVQYVVPQIVGGRMEKALAYRLEWQTVSEAV